MKLRNTFQSQILTKKGYGNRLVVHNLDDPSQFSKSGRNYYSTEVLSVDRRNASKTATYMSGNDQ